MSGVRIARRALANRYRWLGLRPPVVRDADDLDIAGSLIGLIEDQGRLVSAYDVARLAPADPLPLAA